MTLRSYGPNINFGFLDLGEMAIGQCHGALLDHGQQLCAIQYRSNKASEAMSRTCILAMFGLDLGSGHDEHVHHEQQLCEIFSRSDKGSLFMASTKCERNDRQTVFSATHL